MNILGFNPSHHGSVCLLQNGELEYFIQEERIFPRRKYIGYPFRSFINLLKNYKIDFITWGSPSIHYPISSTVNFPLWQHLAHSYNPEAKYHDFSNTHHLSHASHAFYNSGFSKALTVIIDGLGSSIISQEKNTQETETIYVCSYPDIFEVIHQSKHPSDEISISRAYETITMHLGWNRNEAGKTMGLSPYGTNNQTFPDFFKDKKLDPNIFYVDKTGTEERSNPYYNSTFVNEKTAPQLKLQKDPKEWHYDESKITNLEKDLAWKIQNDVQQIVGDYIEKSIKETGLKQVCCAGGYFLNCVSNYYLKKRFPDVEFYFEPIANDAGTAIGTAKLLWHSLTQDKTIRPFKSLYLGKQYSKKKLLKGIKKYT